MNDSPPVVRIIGAGAAGLLAAIAIARTGAQAEILEAMPHPGRKIGITGKGRCNLTNLAPLEEFLGHFQPHPKFLRPALRAFSPQDLLTLLDELGIPTITERGQRVFPTQHPAPAVARALADHVRSLGISIQTDRRVTALEKLGNAIVGLTWTASSGATGRLRARHVILATGGASYPSTGSRGDGYRLAQGVGHSVNPVRPGLVALATYGSKAEDLAGLALRNVQGRLMIDGKRRGEAFGEVECSERGLGGPIILPFSRLAGEALARDIPVRVVLDLKPALSDEQLEARLLREVTGQPGRTLRDVLRTLLPEKLVSLCLQETSLAQGLHAGQVTARQRRRIHQWLRHLEFTVVTLGPWEQAIITIGGIPTREIDPNSMASRSCEGLWVAGEMLDVDGDTGGFNLQAAFSTGWLAGMMAGQAARAIKE